MLTLPPPPPPEQARGGGTRAAYALRARLRAFAAGHSADLAGKAQALRAGGDGAGADQLDKASRALGRVAGCGCHVVMGGDVVEVVVREHGAHWRGILRCGRAHSCPACALKRGATVARQVESVLRADLAALGRSGSDVQWGMLTLTLPHTRDERLADVDARLVRAVRRWRSHRNVRRIFDSRVSATCRAREAKWGARAGWHPHVHAVMRSTPWTTCPPNLPRARNWRGRRSRFRRGPCGACERCIAVRAWCWALDVPYQDETRPNGVSDVATFGLRWSKPCTSADGIGLYVSKMGLEVAGGGVLKANDHGGATPWQLAERAVSGGRTRRERDEARAAGRRWAEYQEASRGRRLLEADERMRRMMGAVSETNEPRAVFQVWKEEFFALRQCEKMAPDPKDPDGPTGPDALWRPLAAALQGAESFRRAIDAACHASGRTRARSPPERAAGAGPPFPPATPRAA